MKKDKEQKKSNSKLWSIILIVVLIIAIALGITLLYMNNSKKEEENTIAYTDLIKEISYGNIEKIEMTVGSTTLKVKQKNEEEEKNSYSSKYRKLYWIGSTKSSRRK